jgi:hypothetical protein
LQIVAATSQPRFRSVRLRPAAQIIEGFQQMASARRQSILDARGTSGYATRSTNPSRSNPRRV